MCFVTPEGLLVTFQLRENTLLFQHVISFNSFNLLEAWSDMEFCIDIGDVYIDTEMYYRFRALKLAQKPNYIPS
jgi:hypothetical protein